MAAFSAAAWPHAHQHKQAFPWPPHWHLCLSVLCGGFVSTCCPLLALCSLGSSVQIPDSSFPGIVTWGKLFNFRFHIHRTGEIIAPVSKGDFKVTAVDIEPSEKHHFYTSLPSSMTLLEPHPGPLVLFPKPPSLSPLHSLAPPRILSQLPLLMAIGLYHCLRPPGGPGPHHVSSPSPTDSQNVSFSAGPCHRETLLSGVIPFSDQYLLRIFLIHLLLMINYPKT